MNLKLGDVVCLLSESDELLGTVSVEEVDTPHLDAQDNAIRYSGQFQPTTAWQSSAARPLFLELDEAVNDGSFSIIDKLVRGIFARGVRLVGSAHGVRIPVSFILLNEERILEWEIAAESSSPGVSGG